MSFWNLQAFCGFFLWGVFFCGADLFRGVAKMVVGVGDIYIMYRGGGNFVY